MALAVSPAGRLEDVDEPPAFLRDHAARVGAELRRTAPPRATRSGRMAAYHMGWEDAAGAAVAGSCGKLLRSGLAMWAAGAAGGEPDDALDAAVAVEWIHNFTLIHDDIQDGDRTRRHRATLWTLVGPAQAINAGDSLHAVAFGVLTRPGPHPRRRLAAANALDRAVLAVIEGQCLDLALERRPPAGVAVALRLARTKTGALVGGALEAGALLAGASPRWAEAMRRAGVELGAAFQLRDDWLGTWGDPALTGKPADADLARRKQTFAVAAAWSAGAAAQRAELRDLLGSTDPAATGRLRALLDELDAGPRTEAAARRLGEAALGITARLGLGARHQGEMGEIAAYVTRRRR